MFKKLTNKTNFVKSPLGDLGGLNYKHMKKIILLLSVFYFASTSFAQLFKTDDGLKDFKFGEIDMSEVNLKTYEHDSTATAVVLKEYGSAYIEADSYNLIFNYHVRIKILKKEGIKHATFVIPLRKGGPFDEYLKIENAATFVFNPSTGQLETFELSKKNVFYEDPEQYVRFCKFTMPNVQEGSIIDVKYTIGSPFIFNFRQWNFQSEIPKVVSTYKTRIPGIYVYNIALKGYLKLDVNTSEIEKDCLRTSSGRADCAVNHYSMRDIPAFVEEDYMTAPSNFISSLRYELLEIKRFNGTVDKITNTWEDVEKELRDHDSFGKQIKRGGSIFKKSLDPLVASETDSLQKAIAIYNFIKRHFKWNEYRGKYTDSGLKKAFENKTGNVGDINLSLVTALQAYGFHASPALSSTRRNGLPMKLFPVMSNFDYVFCHLTLGGKTYMLDATDPYLAFGMLPMRCMNGFCRVLDTKASYWKDIMPENELKENITLALKMDTDGRCSGNLRKVSYGYEAMNNRKKIDSFSSEEEYVEDFDERLKKISIKEFEIEDRQDITKPLKESYVVNFQAYDSLSNQGNLYFNPFLFVKWNENPFKSDDRMYPVDFGAPMSSTYTFSFEYPETYKVVELPKKMSLMMPGKTCSVVFDIQNDSNVINMVFRFNTTRYVYEADDYHSLKQIFARIVQLQKTDIVLAPIIN